MIYATDEDLNKEDVKKLLARGYRVKFEIRTLLDLWHARAIRTPSTPMFKIKDDITDEDCADVGVILVYKEEGCDGCENAYCDRVE